MPDDEWLRFSLAHERDRRIAFCVDADSWVCKSGDPVFLVNARSGSPAIVLYAAISWQERTTVGGAWEKFNSMLGMRDESQLGVRFGLSSGATDHLVDVIILTDRIEISPAIFLRSMMIDMKGKRYREVSPEEVLMILKALPEMAATAWTRRVVARNNEL